MQACQKDRVLSEADVFVPFQYMSQLSTEEEEELSQYDIQLIR